MTKQELKTYINEAIDALDTEDLEEIFPNNNQPSLYALAHELLGMRGEVRKLSKASLKLGNGVQLLTDSMAEKIEVGNVLKDAEERLYKLLNELIKQDETLSRTDEHLQTMPEVGLWNVNKFKGQFNSWKTGYNITIEQWKHFIKSLGLVKTGVEGELFDPTYHEAVAVKNLSHIENNVIVESEVIGYIYKQNLIRRAKVVVNKKKNTDNDIVN